MRVAMPNEESVILLMGKTALDKKSYLRQVHRIDLDRNLFPDERKMSHTESECRIKLDGEIV